jgi:hypothetical protein
VLIFVILLVSYPILYVIASSFSDSAALTAGRVTVLPMVYDKETAAYTLGIDMAGYKFVFAYDEVWKGFRNSIFYTITGTCISLTLIVLMAYPLSKAEYQGRKVISKLLLVAMLISAGLVPVYLLKTKLEALEAKVESVDKVAALIERSPDILERLKEVILSGKKKKEGPIVENAEGGWIHFDYIPGEPDVRSGSSAVIGKICVIGSKIDEHEIAELFGLAE